MSEVICEVVRFDSPLLRKNIGRSWDLGPCVIRKDLNSDSFSVTFAKTALERSIVSFSEFKAALLENEKIPVEVKFAVSGYRGPYGFGELEFDESVMSRYSETKFASDTISLIFNLVAKGKELKIFNGISSNSEQSGSQKPLFWSSILKGNIH